MEQNKKSIFQDIKNILSDKKILILFISSTVCLSIVCIFFCFFLQNEKVDDRNFLVYFTVNCFSLILSTSFPLALSGFIKRKNYFENHNEENTKKLFLRKIFCVFIISLGFAWLGVLLNTIIQLIILGIYFYAENVFYFLLVLPVWLFFVSCFAIKIYHSFKNTKNADRVSSFFPLALLWIFQLLFILGLNFFSYKFFMVPFLVGIFGSVILLYFSNKKFNIEKNLYE